MIADVVVGLQYGDEGKGKVTHHLCKTGDYTHVLRFNGGCNAGHTIFHEGRKFVTHHIPAGVFFGIKSIIGNGCVLDPVQFFRELDELESGGINTKGLIYIAKNCHVITDQHKEEDGKDTAIGTTKRGNGPAYRDKYSRDGYLAQDIPSLKPFLIDLHDEFWNHGEVKILCEGAQGFGLDIDWGDYPFVTSSHCLTSSVLLNAIPHYAIRDVWGVAKAYETYVGTKQFQPPHNRVFQQIQEAGQEFGATTGRVRQCNWIDLPFLKRAVQLNAVNKIVFNKMDVIRQVQNWSLKNNNGKSDFFEYYSTEEDFKHRIEEFLADAVKDLEIHFSDNPHRI
jgi:adenylosuccinate synthase